jgi:hypothetical protein
LSIAAPLNDLEILITPPEPVQSVLAFFPQKKSRTLLDE